MEENESYRKKLEKEQAFYVRQADKQLTLAQKVLRSEIFFSYPRMLYNHRFPKAQLSYQVAQSTCDGKVIILNAPCGIGRDVQYIKDSAKIILGLDIAIKALILSKDKLLPSQADLLKIPFSSKSIDLVVSTLFFHHMLNFGFDGFLSEFYRVLKPGGSIYILEPSVLYPLNVISRPIKKLFNNPYQEVEDESPFHPKIMLKALENGGFQDISFQAATFSHPVFFIPLANFINKVTRRLLTLYPSWIQLVSATD